MIDTVASIHLADGRALSTRSQGKDVHYLPVGKSARLASPMLSR
jgi:hypothetical protein